VEIICDKAAHQTLGADDLVLVEHKHYFIGSVDTDIPDRLRGDLVLVENIDFHYALGTEVDDVLTGVATTEVEDDFLVWVGFGVFT
jgi:hypothetical protein